MTITTGPYQKPETHKKQAYTHEDPHKQTRAQKNEWNPERVDRPREATRGVRARVGDMNGGRSGSDSNAPRRTRGYQGRAISMLLAAASARRCV